MEALRIGSTKPFLMDGTIVEDIWMLKRMQCQVKKYEANPVMRRTHEYEGCGPYLHGTVLHDPDTDRFRMWYQLFRYLEDGVHYTYDVHYAVSSGASGPLRLRHGLRYGHHAGDRGGRDVVLL